MKTSLPELPEKVPNSLPERVIYSDPSSGDELGWRHPGQKFDEHRVTGVLKQLVIKCRSMEEHFGSLAESEREVG